MTSLEKRRAGLCLMTGSMVSLLAIVTRQSGAVYLAFIIGCLFPITLEYMERSSAERGERDAK